MRKIVVVGASAAGLGTAEALRRRGYDGELTLVGAEAHLPYDRPPLSKQVLAGAWEPERVRLRPEEKLADLRLDLRLATRATGVSGRQVLLDGGDRLDFDGLVIATGVVPRTLPGVEGVGGVHVLRTLDDALSLRVELLAGPRLVVVGAGLIGCEVAATARKLGLDVTLIDPLPVPMTRQLGPRLGELVANLHAENGVRQHFGVGVDSVRSAAGRITGVVLTDGTEIEADAMLVGIGATAVTDWLDGSGIPVDPQGVRCDAYCSAAPGVYAAGDVASWEHPVLGRIRLEHRTNASEQAMAVAMNLLGAQQEFRPLPYFWSDQYDTKIQMFGWPLPGDELEIVEGAPAEGSFIAAYRRDGQLTGVLGWNSVRGLRPYRQELMKVMAG
ncbi:FAD-dependent oxidoreductase [Allokutzneria sp. A3M-2-11 16]|uniref:NAD(P)/FAD-dependent oxidoreductase n=1 Tax=Allokutzneria sp. A3M-2-11 16 TaxID=2962043 RepID=UPI0020B8F9AD|nr:FAD-dependent oxidoreductase [Allokutzneria sp. A3M-2-11 16]MCP3798482.1 FAD-dependent oxidoreductase [Allokutzneria sp. A3M-2-11 16]